MRKCYSCGYRYERGAARCDTCGVRLTGLDAFRTWRRVRRLRGRLRRPPATDTPTPAASGIPLEEWLAAPIRAREERDWPRPAAASPEPVPAPADDPAIPAELDVVREHPTP